MGIALLVLILIVLAFVGDWGYRAKYLNERRCRARIAKEQSIINGLARQQASFLHDPEKMQIYHAANSYHMSQLKRYERRLNELEVAKR